MMCRKLRKVLYSLVIIMKCYYHEVELLQYWFHGNIITYILVDNLFKLFNIIIIGTLDEINILTNYIHGPCEGDPNPEPPEDCALIARKRV